MGFTKLFSSITESSVWCESDKTLRIWVAFLARSNAFGIVEGSLPGMANLCRMSVDDFISSLQPLLSADPYSRNPDHDGKRLQEIPGGWQILNYSLYRQKGQEQVGSRADYMRKYRADKVDVTRNKMLPKDVTGNTDAEDRRQKQNKPPIPPLDSEFVTFWSSYPKKTGKKKALIAWNKAKDKPPIEVILKKIEEQKNSEQWKRDGGQYIPNPATWINEGRWDDEVKISKAKW